MIYDILPVNNYSGNNLSTTFDFDFYIDDDSQLKVYLFEEDGTKYLLENNVDYIIEGEKEKNGGYITFPIEDSGYSVLTDKQKLSLELDIPVSQETQYNTSSLLNLESLEYSFDYLTRLIQILKRKLSLCVKVDECSRNTPEELLNSINDAYVNANLLSVETSKNAQQAKKSALEASEFQESANDCYLNTKKIADNLISNGIYKFQLFDIKISDHILSNKDAKGWALQGTYVTKESYPDFYNKCVEEKNSATATEITLADSTLTMYVNNNGHQFYNISDKPAVDTFYDIYGIADFYGIDEENERVFLPRNKYFHQLTDDPTKVNEMLEAGIPNITGGDLGYCRSGSRTPKGALYIAETGVFAEGATREQGWSGVLGFDASKSNSIYGNSDTVQPPSSLKLLYYCVGNTEVSSAITNVTEVTTSENDTIPLFTGMYFDFKPNNVSWLKAGEQQNSAGVYKTCYETLVEIANGVNNFDLKVINQADMVSGVVYDEYWVLDQDNLTFRTPLTIATKSGIIAEQSTSQLYFKVANAVQNLELLDVGEVMEAVNDINANALMRDDKEEIISWGMPDFSSRITIPYNTSIQLPCDAVVFHRDYSDTYTAYCSTDVSLDGTSWFSIGYWGWTCMGSSYTVLPKGIYVKCYGKASTNHIAWYAPLKGVN